MKIETRKLTDRALDYAVALAEGGTDLHFDTVATWWVKINGKDRALSAGWSGSQSFTPSTGPDGDAIIDREKISTTIDHSGIWIAYKGYNLVDAKNHMHCGDTRREAAMRCFVASVLGDVIDVPDSLCA